MNQQAAAAAWRNMLQLACLSSLGRLDAAVADCDGSCGLLDGGDGAAAACLLHSGLCCPADSLDNTVVIEFINNEELLEDLALAASLPPSSSGCKDNSSWTTKTTTTAWHGTTTTASSLAASETPPPTSPEAIVSRLAVPTRKRDRSGRRRRPWSLDMPIIPRGKHVIISSAGDDGVRQQQAGRLVVSRPAAAPAASRRRVQRACSHCESTETPQWRAGPEGPGTLCNACGLRYTLNKLLPEYRPSTSPSFQSGRHSNRHRKVVKLREMRNAKDDTAVVVSVPPAPATQGGDDDGEFMDVL